MSDGLQVAIVSGGFTVLVALIGWAARANKKDHDQNSHKLDLLLKGHDRIEGKIDGHIGDHARGDV